jgi:hypothetical protein
MGVIGKIVGSGVLLVVVSAVTRASGVDVVWGVEAFWRGSFLGLVLVSSEYHRAPAERRLAPFPAMAIGLGSLGVILVALQRAPRPLGEFGWLGWLAVVVMAGAPLSLIAAGALRLRGGRAVAR